ncbi:MAG: phosphoglycerate dehydrogenase [Phycisphaerae bacterium]
MPRILVADKLAAEGLALLRDTPGVDLHVKTDWTPDTLAAAVREADGVVIRSAVKITADALAEPGRLRAIARAGVGVDNIDVEAATRAGVLVMNTPDANTLSTAELAMTLMTAISRDVVAACMHVKSGRWERSKFKGAQLAGKTLGIVGLGRVGRAVAARALAFEMKVLAYDPFFRGQTAMDDRVSLVGSLEELFGRSDYVSLHAALTDASRAMINAEVLGHARPGLRLINCARGDLVDEVALAAALGDGLVAAAAVDVYASEPPPKDHPLIGLDNVICTPHLGASTVEAQSAVSVEAARALVDYLLHGRIAGAVNIADLPRDLTPRDRAYCDLASRVAALLSGLCPRGVDRITVTLHGDGLSHLAPALRRYAVAALLGPYFAGRINIVNADSVAREHGVDVRHVTRHESRGVTDQIEIAVAGGDGEHAVEATVFVDGLPRLLAIDGYRMNIEAAGAVVLIVNDDRPGVIGLVGTVFGDHGVNIADMALSRLARTALMVLRLDAPPPPECLAALDAHDAILSIHAAQLPPRPDA